MCRAVLHGQVPEAADPCTATRSPARARVAERVEGGQAAQRSGAASTDLSSSGTAERPEAAAYITSA